MANNETDKQAKIVEDHYLNNVGFDFGDKIIGKGHKLFSQPVKFIAASNSMSSLPEESISEVAFSGRSNVGKSSLINAITGTKFTARTSQNPGRTQQLNFFSIGENLLRLVDFPGFGWVSFEDAFLALLLAPLFPPGPPPLLLLPRFRLARAEAASS